MAKITRTFTDLDFRFLLHPTSKDVSKKYDENAIKQSIRNLILTRNYERPFHSEIGSPVNSILFEPATSLTSSVLKRSIENLLANFEPRIVVLDISVLLSADNNSVYVTIIFRIVNTTTPIEVELFLERTR